MNIAQALKEKWYIQGFNATPILLLSAANSGFTMKKYCGLSYSAFIYEFRENYCRMHYSVKDLERLAKAIRTRFRKDSSYFLELRRQYLGIVKKSKKLHRKLYKINLGGLRKNGLLHLIGQGIKAVDQAVSVAHLIEPYSLTMDTELKEELKRYSGNSAEHNRHFSILTAPVKKSFVNRAEESVASLARSPDNEQLIEKHLENYGWIRNSYAGKQVITRTDVMIEARSMRKKAQIDYRAVLGAKNRLIKKLRLSSRIVSEIKLIEFLTHWQDERKMNILIAIDYLERLIAELSQRTGIRHELLRYAVGSEFDAEIEMHKTELQSRQIGSIYFCTPNKTQILTGAEYATVVSKIENKEKSEIRRLTGMTACSGTVTGRVRICTGLNSINKLQPGEILVASMTRPEYVPAMKKASGIITDEGGITCHAAIISRELDKPCIIGTKIATSVLKDGDIVEIKGNHGLVVILD
ncbi:MAG: PEP-utilizing enzyme [archaeon]